ncbi:MAG: response regulator transcription factor, partial [Oscillospiraceae bacterium]
MDKEKILIVDDDKNICELLRLYLEKEGYETYIAYDGESAISLYSEKYVDLVLLDVMMPRVDGWEACRRIRAKGNTPIIMLTAKGETFDKVLGLELGADDYIVKPFDTKEVVARIKAVLRRSGRNNGQASSAGDGALVFDNLVVNLTKYELKVRDEVVDTPPKELELIYHLASNPNKVFTRDALLDEVWGFEYYGDSRTIDV